MAFSGTAALLFALLASLGSGPKVEVRDVGGSRVRGTTRLELQWESISGKPLAVFQSEAHDGLLALPPVPSGAAFIRVVGPQAVSEPLRLTADDRVLRLLPCGSLRIVDVPASSTSINVWMQLQGTASVFRRSLALRAGSEPPEFAVPTGPHAVAIDVGMAFPVHSESAVSLGDREVRDIRLPVSPSRHVTIRAQEKGSSKAVEGASIVPPENGKGEGLLWQAIAERCGKSQRNGRLDCGAISQGTRTLGVAAPGFRSAAVSIPPDSDSKSVFDAPARLARLIDVRLLVPGLTDEQRMSTVAVLRPCETGRCADAVKDRRVPFASGAMAVFSKVPPGAYQAWVETPSTRSDERTLHVSGWSDASDTWDVVLPVRSYRAAGKLSLEDGTPVEGTVWLEVVQEGVPRGTLAGRVESKSDGTFEQEFLAATGSSLWPTARSRAPISEGRYVPGVRLGEDGFVPWLGIQMEEAGLRVHLVDRESGEPVVGCTVVFSHQSETDGGLAREATDESGWAARAGLKVGRVSADAECVGYRPAYTGDVELDGTVIDRTLELEVAGDVELLIRSASGAPLAGASVFVATRDIEVSSFPFFVEPDEVGMSGYDGRVRVSGRGDSGVYVLAAGHALYVGRLPRCADRRGCAKEIGMSGLTAFPGLAIQDKDGTGSAVAWVVFSKDGVPIPVPIQRELLRITGGDARSIIQPEGGKWIHRLPQYFGPGNYLVEYSEKGTDGHWLRRPLGSISLPTTERVTFAQP